MQPLTRYEHDCAYTHGDYFSRMVEDELGDWYAKDEADAVIRELEAERDAARAECERLRVDAERLNYIERTFSGCTTQDRYLPIRMIWGKGCNGRTLREACDKHMRRDAAIKAARGGGE